MSQTNGVTDVVASSAKQPTVTSQEDLSAPLAHPEPETSPKLSQEAFAQLIGFNNADNGLSAEIAAKQRSTRHQFFFYELTAYLLLGLQLLLSAVFIILGSLRIDAHLAIAVLGAVSVVSAGILALMKGQGQPMRLSQTRTGLEPVMEQARKMRRDFCAGIPVTVADYTAWNNSYNAVLAAAVKNQPDLWNGTTDQILQANAVLLQTGKETV
jgi:hypothetical protein